MLKDLKVFIIKKDNPDKVLNYTGVVSILADRDSASIYLHIMNTRGSFHETIHDVLTCEVN